MRSTGVVKASLRKLSVQSHRAKARAFRVLSAMRQGMSLSRAARENGVTVRTVQQYVGRALVRDRRGGRIRAAKNDRLTRDLMFPSSDGDVPRHIRGSRAATMLSQFFNDREKLLRGNLSIKDFEAKWRGVRIAGQELFADAGAILGMAEADVLKIEDLYASTGGAR